MALSRSGIESTRFSESRNIIRLVSKGKLKLITAGTTSSFESSGSKRSLESYNLALSNRTSDFDCFKPLYGFFYVFGPFFSFFSNEEGTLDKSALNLSFLTLLVRFSLVLS